MIDLGEDFFVDEAKILAFGKFLERGEVVEWYILWDMDGYDETRISEGQYKKLREHFSESKHV